MYFKVEVAVFFAYKLETLPVHCWFTKLFESLVKKKKFLMLENWKYSPDSTLAQSVFNEKKLIGPVI